MMATATNEARQYQAQQQQQHLGGGFAGESQSYTMMSDDRSLERVSVASITSILDAHVDQCSPYAPAATARQV